MKITSDLFQAFLKCPTKCWLRAAGESGSGNAYAEWVKSQSASYVATQTTRLVSESPKDESVVLLALENFKGGEWRLATGIVVQAQLNSCTLECKLHAIERMPPEGRGRPAKFVPTRFIFTNKLGKDDKLLLTFDALVLMEAMGRANTVSKIIHGDDRATLKVKTPALAGAVRKHVERIAAMLSSPTPPDLVLNRHCTECEFQSRCRQRAIEKDDLSLLNSLSSQERTEFNGKGIFTVTQLSHTFRPRRRPKGLKLKRERYHHSLKALAIRQNKIHIVGSPEFKIEGTPVYVDVEGLPDHDFYYLIGLRVGNGESATRHTMWANAVEGEGKIWHEFLGILGTIEKPVLVHYGSYEKAFFNSMSERHGKPPEGSVVAEAVRTSMNLLSVIFAQIYFPTYSNGLKDVARWLGFTWSAEDASGIQSIMWRNEWEHTKAPLPKEKLIAYNSEDCAALEMVARIVLQSCQRIEKPSSDPADRLEVVVADTLDSKLTMWPKFNSSIEGFEAINKAARWDYQRDRIYVRTDGELKRVKRKKMKSRAKRPPRVGKVVICERPASCLRCQKKGGLMLRTITKQLHDLRFTRSGINGWVVKYQFQVFRCMYCAAFTPWPKEFWDRTMYGRNLAAFIIFETIELCVSQRSVTQTLNRLFGFQMDENVVHRLKASGAEYYDETRKGILAKMVRANLIHADETRIKLHGKTAYVWVFATFHEVVYFYSETREGSLVQTALDGFKGVLVSDFYAAYDSMPCPQQKCILHLMRDLNDAVLDNPYDEDVKGIVTAFAELLRGIVKTIDQWGLRSRFLRKYLVDVARFYKRMSKMDNPSEPALKCRTRLEKDRDKLFTFLTHDGVPWNNNNVEHAIKAFARLRRAIEGLSTPKGIEEYLILLSVCQTCKYMGVDFLDFLRSGEKDIHVFADSRREQKRRRCSDCCAAVKSTEIKAS
jgi:predicted RecB family nuclease